MGTATLTTPQAAARRPQRAAAREPLTRSTRVLLVEDEPLTAEVFARALARDGHRVDVARDGLQALRRLHDEPPSLVVLDMSLPALPGAEVVRRVRRAGHLALPILVVSGCSRAETDLDRAELWPGAWLTKPVKPRELVAVVRRFLDAGRAGPGAEG
ncbi:MAG: response regulator transcription factor [Planctomycetes bacterium]|nr:response regulator transcription factor [Planctomycetota bacterium]